MTDNAREGNIRQEADRGGINQAGANNVHIHAEGGSHIDGVHIHALAEPSHFPVEKRNIATLPIDKKGLGVLGTSAAVGSIVSAVVAVWTTLAGLQTSQPSNSVILWMFIVFAGLGAIATLAFAGFNMIRHRTLHITRWSALPILAADGDHLVFQKWRVHCPTCGRRVRIRNEALRWLDYTDGNGRTRRDVTERGFIARCAIAGHEFRVSSDASSL